MKNSDHLAALSRLIKELDNWCVFETSEPDEKDLPDPIEPGHPLHTAVENLQGFYGGRVPIRGGARDSWSTLCFYSRLHGDEPVVVQARKAVRAAGELFTWGESEIGPLQRREGPWSQADTPNRWAKVSNVSVTRLNAVSRMARSGTRS